MGGKAGDGNVDDEAGECEGEAYGYERPAETSAVAGEGEEEENAGASDVWCDGVEVCAECAVA